MKQGSSGAKMMKVFILKHWMTHGQSMFSQQWLWTECLTRASSPTAKILSQQIWDKKAMKSAFLIDSWWSECQKFEKLYLKIKIHYLLQIKTVERTSFSKYIFPKPLTPTVDMPEGSVDNQKGYQSTL